MEKIKAILKDAAEAQRASDSRAAATLVADALAIAREGDDSLQLAYTLRHTASLRSKLGFFDDASAEIAEATRIYREPASGHALDLANSLRILALNAERQARAAWDEAEGLYASVDVQAGVYEAKHHLRHLAIALEGA